MQFTSMQGATSYNFNPRSRLGFDPFMVVGDNTASISIHEAV